MERDYRFWAAGEIQEFREALRGAITAGAGTITAACASLDPWHGRTENAMRTKVRALGWTHDGLTGAAETPALTDIQADILRYIRERKITTSGELSRIADRSKETVKRTIAELYELGYEVEYADDTKQVSLVPESHKQLDPIDIDTLRGERLKFGVLGDTHFGSREQCLSLVKLAYELFDREGCQFALHVGDIVDGKGVYRGQEADLFLHTADEQVDYTVENYPQWGRKTYIIGGNHDLSFKKSVGLNIVRAICSRRDDLVYRGDELGEFRFDNAYLMGLHPWGGRSYAISYNPQKISIGLLEDALNRGRQPGGVIEIPNAIFIGHYHTAGYFQWGGTETFLVPCLQRPAAHWRVRGNNCNIGCLVIQLEQTESGAVRLVPEYHRWDSLVRERDW